jgi:hypothetical protein
MEFTSPQNFVALTKIVYSFFQDKYQYDITKELSEERFKDILQQSIAHVQNDPELLDLQQRNKATLGLCIRKIKDVMTTTDPGPSSSSSASTSDTWSEQLAQLEHSRKMILHPEVHNVIAPRPKKSASQPHAPVQQTFVSMNMSQHTAKSRVIVIESYNRPFHQWKSRSHMSWNGDMQIADLSSYVSIRLSRFILPLNHEPYIRVHIKGPGTSGGECILIPSPGGVYVPISDAAGYMSVPPLPWIIELKDRFRHELSLGQDHVRILSHTPNLPLGTTGIWKTELIIDDHNHDHDIQTGHPICILTEEEEQIYATVDSIKENKIIIMAPPLNAPMAILNMSQQWTLFVEFFKDR